MKEKIKQEGFIHIPLLIIIIALAVIASAGTGVVLYKQGKLTFLTANTLEMFKRTKEIVTTEEVKSDKPKEEVGKEESQSEQEQPLLKSEKITQKEQESGQTQLEREQQRQEAEKAEQAKSEAEKAKAEIERLKAEQEIKGIEKEQREEVRKQQEIQRLAEEQEKQAELKKQQEAQRIAEEKQKQEEQKQRELEKEQTEEKERIANIKTIDGELSQLISETQEKAHIFSQAKNEADSFISTVRNTMNKYPNSSLIQQSGQQLINELNNLSFISGKLFDIENDRIKTISSFLGSGNIPSVNDFSTPITQYRDYRNQYDLINIKIKSLMETFVTNEKTVLEEILGKKQEELQRKTKATQAITQLSVITQEINDQLTILDSQIKEKEAEIEREKNRLAPMSIIEARLAQLISVYNSLVNQWNSLLDKKQKIATLTYKLDDYANYGVSLSAEDRTFLLSLGISF